MPKPKSKPTEGSMDCYARLGLKKEDIEKIKELDAAGKEKEANKIISDAFHTKMKRQEGWRSHFRSKEQAHRSKDEIDRAFAEINTKSNRGIYNYNPKPPQQPAPQTIVSSKTTPTRSPAAA